MIELKSKREIEKLRVAGRITAEVLLCMVEAVRPGISTWDLDQVAKKEIAKRKAEAVFLNYKPAFSNSAFPAHSCISVNEEIVHGIPRKSKILEDGDIVSLDIATRYDGYVGDTAVTVPVGEVSEEIKRLLKISEQSVWQGILKSVLGNTLGDIGHAIESYVKEHSLHVVKNFFGHGIGREMHEEPMVPHHGNPKEGMKLEEGFAFTIEPMVCQENDGTIQHDDGWTISAADELPAAHFEHSLVITKDGPVVLTII